MTIYDAVATALQQDTEAAKAFMLRLEEQGYMVCKRDDPSAPRDSLSLLHPPTPNQAAIEGDVAPGPAH